MSKMTVEGLRREAKALGYNIVPIVRTEKGSTPAVPIGTVAE